jgi:hypothetical protein
MLLLTIDHTGNPPRRRPGMSDYVQGTGTRRVADLPRADAERVEHLAFRTMRLSGLLAAEGAISRIAEERGMLPADLRSEIEGDIRAMEATIRSSLDEEAPALRVA